MNIKRLTILAVVALLVTGAMSGSARARGVNQGKGDGFVTPAPGTVATAARNWTRAEMLAAQPLDVNPTASNEPMVAPQANGAPGLSAGKEANAALVDAEAGQVGGSPAPAGYGPMTYPFPYTRYNVFTGVRVPDIYKVGIYKKVGKLFFNQNGGSFVCSASVLDNRGLITAGHCLSDGTSTWSTNVVFVPAYRDGAAPYGQWSCDGNTLVTFTAWHVNGSFNRDVAGCKLNLIGGQKLSSIVGALGYAWNWGDNEHYHAMGYPQAAPFDGGKQVICAAPWGRWDDRVGGSPATQAIGCDMTGGSSGGPWVFRFNPGGIGYVDSVNSYKWSDQPNAMYGPYFDDIGGTTTDVRGLIEGWLIN